MTENFVASLSFHIYGTLAEKTFARDLVLCYVRRFELMYIYANRNGLEYNVLRVN